MDEVGAVREALEAVLEAEQDLVLDPVECLAAWATSALRCRDLPIAFSIWSSARGTIEPEQQPDRRRKPE